MPSRDDIGSDKDLVKYRLENAKDCLESAKILFDNKKYKAANNRAYYAILNAINAVHATTGKAYRRHKDAISNFNKDYVKTEIFPRTIGRRVSEAEEIRHESDYDDFYVASREETVKQIDTAEELLSMVSEYCKNINGEVGNNVPCDGGNAG